MIDILAKHSNVHFITPKDGKVYRMPTLELMKKNMTKGKYLDVSLDQSTTATGMSLFNPDSGEWMLSAQIGQQELGRDASVELLIKFLTNFFRESKIERLILEDIYMNSKDVFKVLSHLKLSLEAMHSQEGSPFSNTNIHSILAQSWRSGVMLGRKTGTGRNEVKTNVVNRLLEIEPMLQNLLPYAGKDYDAIESYGIYRGWRQKNVSNIGCGIKISKCLKPSRKAWTRHFKFTQEELENGTVQDFIDNKYPYSKLLQYDTELCAEDTAKRIVKNFNSGWFLAPKKDHSWICIKEGFILSHNEVIVVTCGPV